MVRKDRNKLDNDSSAIEAGMDNTGSSTDEARLGQQVEKAEVGIRRVPVEMRVPCTVWSRVVGYLRPVSSWNLGKKQEFEDRLEYEDTLTGREGED